jgi:osmoprotectant transport system permease protein
VGVLVGHGGLGQLIVGGFNANFYRAEIVTGALGCVLLALLADLLLTGVQRAVTPWTRAVRS